MELPLEVGAVGLAVAALAAWVRWRGRPDLVDAVARIGALVSAILVAKAVWDLVSTLSALLRLG